MNSFTELFGGPCSFSLSIWIYLASSIVVLLSAALACLPGKHGIPLEVTVR